MGFMLLSVEVRVAVGSLLPDTKTIVKASEHGSVVEKMDQWSNYCPAIHLQPPSGSETKTLDSGLSDVNWKLNLQLSHSKLANTKVPNAVVELSLTPSDCPANTTASEKVLIEFTKEELVDFYNKLEEMQAQLDALQ